MTIKDRLVHAWDAFTNKPTYTGGYGPSRSRPAYKTVTMFNTSQYVSSVFNRIAVDVSMTSFKHVKINPENEDVTDMKSALNECLTVEANMDQSHIQFFHDLVYSMFDEGVVAVVPVETTLNPSISGGYDINSLRVGKIINWYPKHVEVQLYNEKTGENENLILEKKYVAIVENPLYAVVNAENSSLKRLVRKLNQLDNVDELADARRLDLLLTMPYSIKTEKQREAAEKRIEDIERQLASGRNGIAYIDATEKAIQLNRPSNPQLLENINMLSQQFHNQLGLTQSIFDGTAGEMEMRNYYTRSIDPIVTVIVSEFNRKFLTKTARTQGQQISYYRDMFKMVPVEVIAKLGDTFRRNEIATSNEIRKVLGWKPSNDPLADMLTNPNIAGQNQGTKPTGGGPDIDIDRRTDEERGSGTSPDNSQNGIKKEKEEDES